MKVSPTQCGFVLVVAALVLIVILFVYPRFTLFGKPTVEGFQTAIVPPWKTSGGFGSKYTWVQRQVLDEPMQAISRDALTTDIQNDLKNANRFVNIQINFKQTDVPTYITIDKTAPGNNDATANGALTLRNVATLVTPEYLATLSTRVRNWVAQYVQDQQNALTEAKEATIAKAVSGNAGRDMANTIFTAKQLALGNDQRKKYADDLKQALSDSVLKQASAVAAVNSVDKIIADVKAKNATAGTALEARAADAKAAVENALLAGQTPEQAMRVGSDYLKGQLPAGTDTATNTTLQQTTEAAVATAMDTAKDVVKGVREGGSNAAMIARNISKFAKITPAAAFSAGVTNLSSQLVGAVATAIADSEDAKCPPGFSPGGSIAENNPDYAISSQVLGAVMPVPLFDYVNAGLTAVSCMRTKPGGTVELATRKRCIPDLVSGNKYYCYGARSELMTQGNTVPYLQLSVQQGLPNCIKPFTLEGLCDAAAQFLFEMTWDFATTLDNAYIVITRFTKILRITDYLMDAEFEFKYFDKTSRLESNLPPDGRTSQCTFVFTPVNTAPATTFRSLITNTDVTMTQDQIINDLALKKLCEGRDAWYFCQNGFIKGYKKAIGMVYQAPFITTGSSLYTPIQPNFVPLVDFSVRFSVTDPVLGISYASFAKSASTAPPYPDWSLLDTLQKLIVNNKSLVIASVSTSSLSNYTWSNGSTLVVTYSYSGGTPITVSVASGSPLKIEPPAVVIPAAKLRPPYWDTSKMPNDSLLPSKIALKGGRSNLNCGFTQTGKFGCASALPSAAPITVTDLGNNKVTLQGGPLATNYCSDEGTQIMCNRATAGTTEQFLYNREGANTVIFKGQKNNKFCTDDADEVGKCNRDVASQWERFTFVGK